MRTKQSDKPKELVVFTTGTTGLPAAVQKAIERFGARTREKVGIEPTWKPTGAGQYVLGEVLSVRHKVGEFQSSVIVLNTSEGAVSVWLSADLKMKLDGVSEGKVFCIVYEGLLLKKDNPKLKNDMKLFKVVEILPPEK